MICYVGLSIPTGLFDENLFVPSGFYELLLVVTLFGNIDGVGTDLYSTNIIMITAAFTSKHMCFVVCRESAIIIRSIKLSAANMAHGIYSFLINRLFVRVRFLIYNVYVLILRVMVNSLVYSFVVGFTRTGTTAGSGTNGSRSVTGRATGAVA